MTDWSDFVDLLRVVLFVAAWCVVGAAVFAAVKHGLLTLISVLS